MSKEEVWTWAEQRQGSLVGVSLEILGKGKELAQTLETRLSSILITGEKGEELAQELITHGADRVFLVEEEWLGLYQSEAYIHVIADLVAEHQPQILIMGGNSIGLDLAPKVAARLRTGLTAHCVELSIEEVDGKHLLVGAIPGFGGNVMVKIACPEKMPQMVTVRPGVFEKAAREEGRKGEIVKVKPRIKKEELRIRTLEVVEEKPSEATLDEAEAIVVGGWGLQAAGGFDPVEELAGILGGVVAGTRPAVDAGWIPEQKMIGVSGKTVSPKLLVSVGASGAMHFVAGFPKAKCVLAINKDPKAPIFEACDIGIVGDLREVVPQLCQKLKELTL